MMNFTEFLNEQIINQPFNIQKITSQEAIDRGMFGVVYHGTSVENWDSIKKNGFRIEYNTPRNSYQERTYGNLGLYPPIHHLGYGVYFTTVKSIATNFNAGTSKNLYKFYLDIPNKAEINFGSPRTMMEWWLENGFEKIGNDSNNIMAQRIDATKKMTDVLSDKYDAVWYKGKGYYRLLDGDQICVYDTSKIYLLDDSNVTGYNVGAKVIRAVDKIGYKYYYSADKVEPEITEYIQIPKGTKGVITKKNKLNDRVKNFEGGMFYGCDYSYEVKWIKGGIELSVREKDIQLI